MTFAILEPTDSNFVAIEKYIFYFFKPLNVNIKFL